MAVAQLIQLLTHYPKFKGLITAAAGTMCKCQKSVAKVVDQWWYNRYNVI